MVADQLIQTLTRIQPVGTTPTDPVGQQAGRAASVTKQDAEGLTFSRHLNDRINRRSIELDGDKISRLSSAVDRAAGKGARDSVVLLDDLAVLVNVSNRTVLTAIETGKMRDGVFTNIDSVVVG